MDEAHGKRIIDLLVIFLALRALTGNVIRASVYWLLGASRLMSLARNIKFTRSTTAWFTVSSNSVHQPSWYTYGTIDRAMSNIPTISETKSTICLAHAIMPRLNSDYPYRLTLINLTGVHTDTAMTHYITRHNWFRSGHSKKVRERWRHQPL